MKYYEDESKFNGVYSRDNLPKKIKNKAYVVSLDNYADIGTHWVVSYVSNNKAIYFDSFGAKLSQKKLVYSLDKKT